MRKATLLLGDCVEILPTLQSIHIDHSIADIPYNIQYDSWDHFDINQIKDTLYRILPDTGNLIIFTGYSDVINVRNSLDSKFQLQDWIIYDRIKGRGATRHLVSTREDILWYSKGNNYIFNKIPSNILKVTKGLGEKNGNPYRALTNVWTDISPIVPWSKERTDHPTQKPIQLMERCINIWTNPGDTILDFTMGSGSTGIAALNLSRNFIGIEKYKQYYDSFYTI